MSIFRIYLKTCKVLIVVGLCFGVWSGRAWGDLVWGWYEDGPSYDYFYSYNYELQQDIGDPWKTLGTWSNCLLTPKPVTVHLSQSHSVTIQAGWEELIVALLNIQETVTVSQDVPYTIPPCTKTATAKWRWLGDYISGGGVSKYSEDRLTYIDGWNIEAGYYNYSPEFSGLETTPCSPCPVPNLASLTLAVLGLGTAGGILQRRKALC